MGDDADCFDDLPGRGAAAEDWHRQVRASGAGYISLDGLWRAAGRPADKSPAAWVRAATPLIDGLAGYTARLGRRSGLVARDGQPLMFVLDRTEGVPPGLSLEVDDLMAHRLIAWAYVIHLECEVD